ncbi:MAG TPA: TolC family protein [Gammaproteobacteria bacterium]|nr:TolC family protein [Gammaproteobacteria bacterium]
MNPRTWLAISLMAGSLGALAAPPPSESIPAAPTSAVPEVHHVDPLRVDSALPLSEVVRTAIAREPREGVVTAQRNEARALARYGSSYIAGAPAISVRHQNDALGSNGGLREWEAGVELPLWRPGQRSASQTVARKAALDAETYGSELSLQVAGEVREALWNIALRNRELAQARQDLKAAQALARDIDRRVQLGDLPRQDRLLAQSELLTRQSAVLNAEAEQMHARQRYRNLTGLDRMPADFREQPSAVADMRPNHPRLARANAAVARARAEQNLIRTAGPASPTVTIGTRHERDISDHNYVNSIGLTLRIPIGTGTHTAPARAAAARVYSEAVAQRDLLRRELALSLHEAKHALEVTEAAMKLARREARVAVERLRLARVAFENGELDLVEFLRVQNTTFMRQRSAGIRVVEHQRAIARYNQTVGVMP